MIKRNYIHITIVMVLGLLFILNDANAQRSTKFEISISRADFSRSNFLQNSSYQSELDDPIIENIGYTAYQKGNSHSLNLRYLKPINSHLDLVLQSSYTEQQEEALCFCNSCDKIFTTTVMATTIYTNLGLGLRYHLGGFGKFDISIESDMNLSKVWNESDFLSYNVQLLPILNYSINDQFGVNLKYGWKKSMGDYQFSHRSIEFGINKKI